MTVAVGRLFITVSLSPPEERAAGPPQSRAERALLANQFKAERERTRTRYLSERTRWP